MKELAQWMSGETPLGFLAWARWLVFLIPLKALLGGYVGLWQGLLLALALFVAISAIDPMWRRFKIRQLEAEIRDLEAQFHTDGRLKAEIERVVWRLELPVSANRNEESYSPDLSAPSTSVSFSPTARQPNTTLSGAEDLAEQGRLSEAIVKLEDALKAPSVPDSDRADVHGRLARYYMSLGVTSSAIWNLEHGLEFRRRTADVLGEATMLRALGYAHQEKRDLNKAEDYLQQALAIYKANNADEEMERTLADIDKLRRARKQGRWHL